MTKVLTKSTNGRYYIKARGHATGSPIVCAGVSAIIYALAGYLENNGGIRCEEITLSDGVAELEFYGGDDAEAVYMMAVIGLAQIEEHYPEYIEIKEELP